MELKRLELVDHVAEKFGERHRVRIEMHEYKFFPDVCAERNESIFLAIEILDALEVGNTFERSVEAVGPAMIRALQAGGGPAGLGHDCGGVMAADVEKSAQHAILTADNQDRLATDFGSDVLARR